jgi:hypothetical protein
LANEKFLNANESKGLSKDAVQLMQAWWEEGWWQSSASLGKGLI